MMKTIMSNIESEEFAARLNVASSFKFFLRTAYKEPPIKDLIELLRNSPQNIWLVLERTTALSQEKIDSRYENPWDTALTMYLWALSLVNLEVAETAAGFVTLAKNCWWATRFANSLLQKKESTTRSNITIVEFEKMTPKITAKPLSNIQPTVSFERFASGNFSISTVSHRRVEKKIDRIACAWTIPNTMAGSNY